MRTQPASSLDVTPSSSAPSGTSGPFDARVVLTAAAGVVLLSGCVSLPAVTSGQIGCSEQDIQILDDSGGFGGVRTWVADCHGKRFYCSAHSGGGQSTAQVACKPEAEDAPAATPAVPASGGCTSDAQCKGERICKAGVCVDP